MGLLSPPMNHVLVLKFTRYHGAGSEPLIHMWNVSSSNTGWQTVYPN